MFAYPIVLTPDDNDTLLVTCPDLPEVTSFGDDEADALGRAVGALEEAIAARIARRDDVPAPSRPAGAHLVALPTETALKVTLYQEMRAAGLRKADLARLLELHKPQVDRLLNLRHGTRLDQLDRAFAALGKRLDLRVEDAA
jgi:antitoxin HicB